jgi:hypothetical protein
MPSEGVDRLNLLAHWRDIPLTDPRVEAVADALIQESKGLGDSPQTWRAAQIAVAALADHHAGAVTDTELDAAVQASYEALMLHDNREAMRVTLQAFLAARRGQ